MYIILTNNCPKNEYTAVNKRIWWYIRAKQRRGRMNISEILELNERVKDEGNRFPKKRYFFNEIQSDLGKHFIGIVALAG